MKKIIALLLAVVLSLSFVGCNFINPTPEQTTVHTHEFVLSETDSKAATCTEAGVEVKVCSCGEKQETVLEATDHDMRVSMEIAPSCTKTGSVDYRCSKCGKMKYTNVDATGHTYEESSSEPSRAMRCLNGNCNSCKWGESNGTHTEALTFKFGEEEKAALDAKYDEVKALLDAAERYDPDKHQYAEEGALADEFEAVDAKHTELYDLVMNAISQAMLAEITYYCNMRDSSCEENYKAMQEYRTAVIAKFYTLSRPFYDSCYRDFYYYGMTEEEIMAFLFDSDTVSNPEYTALKDRNSEIEAEVIAGAGNSLADLYYEFVQNNNAMAKMMGYDNYLEYAYENVYGREYTYQDVAQLSEYVKTYMSPAFNQIYNRYRGLSGYTNAEKEKYENQTKHSFFTNYEGNTFVNDYIDLLGFTSNPDKQISFSDEFNKLMGDGNMFRGQYDGAFVTTISSVNIPIAYFGSGYDSPSTIVHEFGHFMNEIYSADVAEENSDFSQSYDLLEMHSQGNELLYLCYLEENANYPEMTNLLVKYDALVNMFYIVMAGMTIDSFEQAIYLDTYNGTYADEIMADGTITANEYSKLYTGICIDYGVREVIDGYWEHGMTVTSPCYYVSYSVSAISVLQLYEMAKTDGFDVAKDAYLKLFTYVDENPEMSFEEVLAYAGLLSFKDEQLYINLNTYFKK